MRWQGVALTPVRTSATGKRLPTISQLMCRLALLLVINLFTYHPQTQKLDTQGKHQGPKLANLVPLKESGS